LYYYSIICWSSWSGLLLFVPFTCLSYIWIKFTIEANAFNGSVLSCIVIPSSVEFLGWFCLSVCTSLVSVAFESNSRLVRIEESAFSGSGLTCIAIPSSVEFLGDKGFSKCKHLQSMTFDANSRLRHIGRRICIKSAISPILPSKRWMVFEWDLSQFRGIILKNDSMWTFPLFSSGFQNPEFRDDHQNSMIDIVIFSHSLTYKFVLSRMMCPCKWQNWENNSMTISICDYLWHIRCFWISKPIQSLFVSSLQNQRFILQFSRWISWVWCSKRTEFESEKHYDEIIWYCYSCFQIFEHLFVSLPKHCDHNSGIILLAGFLLQKHYRSV
jgi:hypothetical protein